MPTSYGVGPSPLGIIEDVSNTNNVTITATEAIVLSTKPFLAIPGRYYMIQTSNLHWQSTVASDIIQWQLRLAQNGAAASVSNPRITATPCKAHVANAARGDSNFMKWLSTGRNLSGMCIVSLTAYRLVGSGTCTTPTANQRPRQLWVEDRGT